MKLFMDEEEEQIRLIIRDEIQKIRDNDVKDIERALREDESEGKETVHKSVGGDCKGDQEEPQQWKADSEDRKRRAYREWAAEWLPDGREGWED